MMEDAGIQYIVERNCELAQVGGNLDTKGYGIATRPDSGFKDLLDSVSRVVCQNGLKGQTMKCQELQSISNVRHSSDVKTIFLIDLL